MSKYIDADELIYGLFQSEEEPYCRGWNAALRAAVEHTPTADVQDVKHGRWYKGRVSSTGGGSYGVYQCSICEAMFPDIGYGYNYCPICGAKMDEVTE